jgi:hypothetical protein
MQWAWGRQGGNAGFDGGNSDRLRLRERIPPDRHETSDRSGRWDPVKIFEEASPIIAGAIKEGNSRWCRPLRHREQKVSLLAQASI